MARCRRCGSSGWTVRTDALGLCRPCGTAIQADARAALARVKESLVFLRCARTPDSVVEICDACLRELAPLVEYERRGVVSANPKPSALAAMLAARRSEALAGGVASPAGGPPAKPSPPRAEAAAAPRGEPPADGSDWWAWDLDDEDRAIDLQRLSEPPEPPRRPPRKAVRCFVLLEPGGIRATLENLSEGGLFLRAGRLRPPGSRVRLLLSTSEGPLAAEGTVRWVRPEGGKEAAGMGIAFTRQSAELRSFLDGLFGDGPAPAERPGASPVHTAA